MNQPDITVSLEPHLLETLTPLPPILPPSLSSALSATLSRLPSPTPEISYALLSEISQWSRTPSGQTLLKSNNFDPNSYLLVSLLAGAKTSPASKFPNYKRPADQEEDATRKVKDRKEITAILNSLLSIGATGFAVWWAADKSGWRDEWVSLTFPLLNRGLSLEFLRLAVFLTCTGLDVAPFFLFNASFSYHTEPNP